MPVSKKLNTYRLWNAQTGVPFLFSTIQKWTALPAAAVYASEKQDWTESAERVGIIEKVPFFRICEPVNTEP